MHTNNTNILFVSNCTNVLSSVANAQYLKHWHITTLNTSYQTIESTHNIKDVFNSCSQNIAKSTIDSSEHINNKYDLILFCARIIAVGTRVLWHRDEKNISNLSNRNHKIFSPMAVFRGEQLIRSKLIKTTVKIKSLSSLELSAIAKDTNNQHSLYNVDSTLHTMSNISGAVGFVPGISDYDIYCLLLSMECL